jgi:leucine-rich repeat kinase 2
MNVKGQQVMGQKIPASYLVCVIFDVILGGSYLLLQELQKLFLLEAQCVNPALPIIDQMRVQRIVREAGIDLEDEELRQAIAFQHETGVVLHYEDAPSTLTDLYVLDPEWLCRMMAQVCGLREINPFVDKRGVCASLLPQESHSILQYRF